MDLIPNEERKNFEQNVKSKFKTTIKGIEKPKKILFISSIANIGLEDLLDSLAEILSEQNKTS